MVGTCGVVKHCNLSYKNYQDYFDRRDEVSNLLSLTKATVTRVQVAGMGDRVCVDLCSLMRPGEGLLVCFHFLICNSTIIIIIVLIEWDAFIRMAYLFLRLDPLLEGYSLCTQNVWNQITLPADLFVSMQ